MMKTVFHSVSGAACAALLLWAGQAVAAPAKASMDIKLGAGYSSNPYLTTGKGLSSAYADILLAPRVSFVTERSEVDLSAGYHRTEYFQHYGGSNDFNARIAGKTRVNPKLTLNGALSFSSEVVGQGDFDSSTGGISGGITDVSLIGQRQRAVVYAGTAGFGYQLSRRDTITGKAGVTRTHYPNRNNGSDSTSYGGGLNYARAISARTTIGAGISVYRIDYELAGLDSTVIQPEVTFSQKLSETWTFDATAGVSITRAAVVGGMKSSTGFAGSLGLCHRGRLDSFCLRANRGVQASGLGGVATNESVTAYYQRQLSETMTASAEAGYGRSNSRNVANFKREYVRAQAGLAKRVAPRLTLGLQAHYRDAFSSTASTDADIGGDVSATYTLGHTR